MKILRVKDLEKKIGLSRATIYRRIDPKSPHYDPTFPKSISLGFNSVGWIESEVDDWINGRIRESRQYVAAA